jgi:hypothetical protein
MNNIVHVVDIFINRDFYFFFFWKINSEVLFVRNE